MLLLPNGQALLLYRQAVFRQARQVIQTLPKEQAPSDCS
jgi:hypothetical protein